MVPVKVAISGQPGTGKTKTVLRIAKMVEEKFNIGGFTTHPIDCLLYTSDAADDP